MPSTGVRVINSLIANGGTTSGTFSIYRVGPVVSISASGLQMDGTGSSQLCSLPSGFRPGTRVSTEWCIRDTPLYFDIYASGSVWCARRGPGLDHFGIITYLTADPWPTGLPGTAA